jgi:cellulose 1,4-beta-cellobiosidase
MRGLAIFLSLLGVALAVPGNLFTSGNFYVNPSYIAELNTSIATATGQTQENLKSMENVGSAYWIDVMGKISGSNTSYVSGILADAASKSPPPLVVLIVYDLPNRDCHAKASNGEICCYYNADNTCNYDKSGDCADGINTYKTKYIDPLAAVFKQYDGKVPLALVIEPDSLPNLATNQADPHCGNSATTAAYTQGVPYAVKTIAANAPNAAMYLDAAHGGWLGWTDNLNKYTTLVQGFGITQYLRGFATNVANYQPIGVQCQTSSSQYCLNGQHQTDICCADPCHLESEYNPGNNELNYVAELNAAWVSLGYSQAHYIIDSGRNGVANMRQDCANWCNIRGAGVGQKPTSATANTTLVDAYYWLKTPGESDGCTQTLPDGSTCARYDSFCGSSDSIGSQSGEPRAPVAGNWFDYQIKQLATNANFDGK